MNQKVTEQQWDTLRVYLDKIGMRSLEHLIADGIDPELAGKRIAEFNDMVMAKMRKKVQGED